MQTKKTNWCVVIWPLLIAAIIMLVIHCVKRDKEKAAQYIIDSQNDTVYSLQHPEIVGTNELGEVIKRYHIYGYGGATIYEVGKTKTEIINRGKFGTTTNVSVEE